MLGIRFFVLLLLYLVGSCLAFYFCTEMIGLEECTEASYKMYPLSAWLVGGGSIGFFLALCQGITLWKDANYLQRLSHSNAPLRFVRNKERLKKGLPQLLLAWMCPTFTYKDIDLLALEVTYYYKHKRTFIHLSTLLLFVGGVLGFLWTFVALCMNLGSCIEAITEIDQEDGWNVLRLTLLPSIIFMKQGATLFFMTILSIGILLGYAILLAKGHAKVILQLKILFSQILQKTELTPPYLSLPTEEDEKVSNQEGEKQTLAANLTHVAEHLRVEKALLCKLAEGQLHLLAKLENFKAFTETETIHTDFVKLSAVCEQIRGDLYSLRLTLNNALKIPQGKEENAER